MNQLNRMLTLGLASIATLAGCGGGIEGTGHTPPPTAQMTSSGAMTRGSVILNGTRFDDATAVITDDRNRTAAQLGNGMIVRLRGRSDDGLTGTADRVDVENEVRAAIQSIDAGASPQRFIVAGLTVLVDSATVLANVASFAALQVGQRVEVHGLRDDAGLLRATRVERVDSAGADEVRGPVSGVDTSAKRFTINGNVTVNYGAAAFSPAGTGESDLRNGRIVEVRGTLAGSLFTATQIAIEDLEDATFAGNSNERQAVEGFITGFTAHPGVFQVNGRTVETTAATRFEDGAAADVANGVRVEVEGTINASGVLVATEIEFRQTRVILHGLATAVDVGARTVVVLNQTVRANDLTRIDTRGAGGGNSTSLADLTPLVDCVEVRGFMDGTTIVADEIKEPSGCPSNNRSLVQARVTAESETTFTLTFFGNLTALLGGAGVEFRDANDVPITRTAFFAAVIAPPGAGSGTLVKVRGQFAANALTAEEAELEH